MEKTNLDKKRIRDVFKKKSGNVFDDCRLGGPIILRKAIKRTVETFTWSNSELTKEIMSEKVV